MRLIQHFIDRDIRPRAPAYVLFEVHAAIKSEALDGRTQLSHFPPEENPLNIDALTIDASFVDRYYDPSLPYIKAADLVFLSIAKKDRVPLITEDAKLYRAAKAAGIEVYRIIEYLAAVDAT